MFRRALFGIRLLALILLFGAGCTKVVHHDVASGFDRLVPYTVAVLPVEWAPEAGKPDKDVARLFRKTEVERLRKKFYAAPAVETVDEVYGRLGEGFFRDKAPGEIASALETDAVLTTTVTRWRGDVVVSYAYVELGARFTLYNRDGTVLWSAEHKVDDSDIRLDRESMEIAIIDVYEPRVQRLVDLVFQTLPNGVPPSERRKFFDWLP